MKKTMVILTVSFAISFLILSPSYAEENKDKATYKQSLLDILKPLKEMDTCEVQAKVVYTINTESGTKDIQQQFKISAKGKDLTFVSLNTEQGNIQFFRDGSKLTIYSEADKKFIERDTPEGLRFFGFIRGIEIMDKFIFEQDKLPNFDVIAHEIVSNKETGQKEKYYQIAPEKGEKFDLWFTDETSPKLVKIETKVSVSEASSAGTAKFYFSDWKFNTPVDDNIFKFTPPEGVTKLERKEEKDPLLGKKAPEFTLTSLDGKQISLKDFNGKKVIVLDFWASWCGPCRMAMPVVQAVSEELKDQDVVFFAVNIQEEKSVIDRFIQKLGIKLPVLMDKTGRVSEKYMVQSIPRMVIIGKDGIVQGAHSGFSQGMKESLKKEILNIISGKTQ